MKSKWLRFLLLEKGKKTNLWRVENKNCLILGFIRWYSQWRQYCFISNDCDKYNVIYSQSCLRDIANFIKEQMDKRKKHYCGECYFRDYGTDSHYVCQEGGEDNWFRVRKDTPACPKFRRKK